MIRWHRPIIKPWLAVALITACGAFLRLYAIGSLPPGLYRDEAYNGLDALRVLDGAKPIFFEANNGREPLFIYLQALSVGLLGRSPAALRLVSALVGTLTIPALYALGASLYGRRVGLLTASLCATTVWTLNLSRLGFRAVTFPPIMACSLLLLWHGLRYRAHPRGLRCMAAAGMLYGLSFYTYLAARFSVLALLLYVAYLLLKERGRFWARGWLLFVLSSFLVALPLALYFVRHWDSTMGRAAQVSILNPAINGGDLWGTFFHHLVRTLGAFLDSGDTIPRHNVPGRAIFDPLVSLAFWAGLVLSLRRAWRQSAYALGLIWLGVMIWPTILAEDAPHFLRASGILPVLFFFPALGLAEFWALVARYRDERVSSALVALVLAISAILSIGAYWRHTHSLTAYYNLEAGPTEIATEINRFLGSGWQGSFQVSRAAPLADRHVYLAPRLWANWPSVRYLCPPSPALTTEPPANESATGRPAAEVLLVLWPYENNDAYLPLLPTGQLLVARTGAQERGDLESESRLLYITLRTMPLSAAPANAHARWAEGIALVGYTVQIRNARQLAITLYWRAERDITASYTTFCHIMSGEELVGQHDGPPANGYYPTNIWRPGDTVADTHIVDLTSDFRPGSFRLQIGLYAWETMKLLPLLDAQGQPTSKTTLSLDLSEALQPAGLSD